MSIEVLGDGLSAYPIGQSIHALIFSLVGGLLLGVCIYRRHLAANGDGAASCPAGKRSGTKYPTLTSDSRTQRSLLGRAVISRAPRLLARRCASVAVVGGLLVACAPFDPSSAGGSERSSLSQTTGGHTAPQATVPMPASQQQAQETILAMLQKTVDILPTGSVLDGSRYRIGTMAHSCEDDPVGTTSAEHVEDWRDVQLPDAADAHAVIKQTADAWRRWGWHVMERDGFERPNRFGYSPDGYALHLEARSNGDPLLVGSSPCFSNGLQEETPRNPALIAQRPR